MFAGRPLKNIGTATGKAPTEKPPSQCCEITPTVPTCVFWVLRLPQNVFGIVLLCRFEEPRTYDGNALS